MNRLSFLLSFVACTCFAVQTFGQLTYVSQTRTVSASPDGGTQSAPDFGPFNGAINTTDGGSATQTSTLGPSSISDSGTVHAQRPAAAGTGTGNADSFLDVKFSLANPQSYSLSGSIPNIPPPPLSLTVPSRYVELLDGQGNILFQYGGVTNDPDQFSHTGTLTAGTYELKEDVAGFDQMGAAGVQSGNFAVNFAVPEPSSVLLAGCAMLWPLARRRRDR